MSRESLNVSIIASKNIRIDRACMETTLVYNDFQFDPATVY